MKYFSVLILTLCLQSYLFGQQVVFTKERDKFIKEWQRFANGSEAEDWCKERLPDLVKSQNLNEGTFQKIVDNCNSLQEKKFLVYPEIYRYMQCALYQSENKFPSVFSADWYSIMIGMQAKNYDKLGEFLEFSYNLFRYRALYKEDSYRWLFEQGNMAWNNDKKLSIVCKEGNLVCRVYDGPKTVMDSIVVLKTSGTFDVFGNKWEGRAGTITWQKVKFDKDKTFARLRGYKCDMKTAYVRVDTVELTTPYFTTPILGKLMDKTIIEKSEGEGSPQFNSFEKRLKIPNLRENLDYDGGFTLEGAEFIGRGTLEKPAKVILKRDNKKLFEIAAIDFIMSPTKVFSRSAGLKMYYAGGDSISIIDGILQLDYAKKQLNFTAAKKGNNMVPYEDSYFKVFVNAPVLVHPLGSSQIYYTFEEGTAQEQKVVDISSFDFFDPSVYQKFKGIASVHPFTNIAKKCEELKKYDFSEGDLATVMNKAISQAKPEMVDMAAAGFLTYNAVSKMYHVENKLIVFANAGTGQRDYDYLKITSDLRPLKLPQTQQEIQQDAYLRETDRIYKERTAKRLKILGYAVIEMDKKVMRINETDEVYLSVPQQTSIYPDSNYVRMEKNRALRFNGWLVSGKMEIHTDEGFFDYENFKVTIPSSSEAFLRVNPLRKEDGGDPIAMVSTISGLKGDLQIDRKDSKNGKIAKNGEYPILTSTAETRVYYDDKSILKGAYDRNRFYYAMEPFVLDSLDNFSEKALTFAGELNSGGIFPKIKERLKIMNDYSFGFSTTAPAGGYVFYESDTKYENKIVLSNNGLQGQGTINFLHSTSVSNKLTFLPDSTIGLAKFNNKEIATGTTYPQVSSEAAYICYQPKKQIMKASSHRDVPLSMFNGETNLTGNLLIDKKGITGDGELKFKEAVMKSKLFSFTHQDINSDNTSFSLLNRYAKFGEDPVAIHSEGLKAAVSFKDRKGVFSSDGAKPTNYPANKYYCRWEGFVWKMDGESIEFEKGNKNESAFEAGLSLAKENCFCTDEKQDSLRFKTLKAFYDLKQQTLFCQKVDFIQVGDAHLFPDSNKVNIRLAGIMDPLKNAKITASFINKYHNFIEANVQVKSRKVYEGTAKYKYYDRDSVLTVIPLNSIRSNARASLGVGEIPETANFKLSKEFDYFGKINVLTTLQGVILEGQTRINHTCKYEKSWMSFKDTIVSKNIQIPIAQNPVNAKGEKLANGFLWRDTEKMDSLRIYPSFLSKKEGVEDEMLFSSYGYLQFNKAANEYQIGTKYRLNKVDTLSNLLTMHLGTCAVTGLGDIKLGINLADVQPEFYGKIDFNTGTNKTTIFGNMRVNVPLTKDLFDALANKIRITEEFPQVDMNLPSYDMRNTLSQWCGKSKMEDVMKDFDEDKLRKMPACMENTLILAGVKLESYATPKSGQKIEKGLICREGKVAILSMNGTPILKEAEMQMFFLQTPTKESGQGFSMNLALPNDRNYFINYTMEKRDGTMLFFTSDAAFNKIITDVKPDKRKAKNFLYDVAEPTLGANMVSKFKGYFLYR
ncbi:MAG: hypothetical protein RL264_235 [Bacteroidota bacterium]|jgi:hypothetical protein